MHRLVFTLQTANRYRSRFNSSAFNTYFKLSPWLRGTSLFLRLWTKSSSFGRKTDWFVYKVLSSCNYYHYANYSSVFDKRSDSSGYRIPSWNPSTTYVSEFRQCPQCLGRLSFRFTSIYGLRWHLSAIVSIGPGVGTLLMVGHPISILNCDLISCSTFLYIFIPYLLSRLAQHQKIHFRVRRTFLIDRELVVIIKCAPDYGPGGWTVIASSLTRRSGWFFLFISIQTPLWAHRRRNKYSYRQQNKEEWRSLDPDVSILVTSFFVQTSSSSYYLLYTWPEKPNIRGKWIRSLNSNNRGSANRKGGVARKGKNFITFVSPSSAFRYTFTRRHLWGKTLLLYLSSTFWIYIPLTYLTRSQWDLSHYYLEPITASKLIVRTFDTRSPRRKCSDRCRWWHNE